VNIPAAGFRNAKIGDVFARGATARRVTAEWMARGDSAYQEGLVRCPQSLADCSASISMVVNAPAAAFSIPKIGDVFACGAAAREATVEWMLPGEPARRVGPGRYLRDCLTVVAAYQRWGICHNGGTKRPKT